MPDLVVPEAVSVITINYDVKKTFIICCPLSLSSAESDLEKQMMMQTSLEVHFGQSKVNGLWLLHHHTTKFQTCPTDSTELLDPFNVKPFLYSFLAVLKSLNE